MTATTKLSILIPSLVSRSRQLGNLLCEITRQIGETGGENAVEYLAFVDGGEEPLGDKRNRLLKAASGVYVAFVDDDDMICRTYIEELLGAIDDANRDGMTPPPDIITFDVEFENVTSRERRVHSQRLSHVNSNEIDRRFPGRTFTSPTHIACWRREIALANSFPPINYAEDLMWYRPLLLSGLVKTEHHIDWPLYVYRYDGRRTSTQGRQERERAREWAGAGVEFYGGGPQNYAIKGYRKDELADAEKYLKFNEVPHICTVTID